MTSTTSRMELAEAPVAPRRRPIVRGEDWERQPGETSRAFSAFVAYRDLGAERSLNKVFATRIASPKALQTWADNYRWVERARAFDNMLDRQKVQAEAAAVRDMARRHVQTGKALQGTGLTYVEKHLKTPEQLARLAPSTALRFIEAGVRMEREGMGVTEDNKPAGDVTNIQVNVLSAGRQSDIFAQVRQMAEASRLAKALATDTAPTEDIVDAEVLSDDVEEPEIE